MINDLIDLFLIRNYPDSFSANEINSQLNAELSEYSEIQFFKKAIYAYLSSDDCNCIHTNKDNTPRFRIRDESFMGVETVDTLRKRAKKGVLYQEIIIKNVLSLLLEERDGLKLKDILYEIKNDVTATAQDVRLVLWGTLRSNISFDKVSFNYKITNVDLALELKEDLKYLEEEHEILGAEDETRAKELIQTFGFTEESEDYFLSKRRWLTFEGIHRESADVSIEENSKYSESKLDELRSFIREYGVKRKEINEFFRLPPNERLKYKTDILSIRSSIESLVTKINLAIGDDYDIKKHFGEKIDAALEDDITTEKLLLTLKLKEAHPETPKEFDEPNDYQSDEIGGYDELQFKKGLGYSIFYNEIPTPNHFKKNADAYKAFLLKKAALNGVNREKVMTAIFNIQNSIDDILDWRLLFTLFISEIDFASLTPNESLCQLYSIGKAPFQNFLIQIETYQANLNFKEDGKFQSIIEEICRDNKVTDAEEAYLMEKAELYGIDKGKVQLYISNEFRNYPSFAPLIDEICEDGVITHAEKQYIEEKAKIYNIENEILEKLINIALFKVNLFQQLKANVHFRRIIVFFFFIQIRDSDNPELAGVIRFMTSLSKLDDDSSIESRLKLLSSQLLTATRKIITSDDLIELVELDEDYDELLISLGIDQTEFLFDADKRGIERFRELSTSRVSEKTFKLKEIHAVFHPLMSFDFDRDSGDHVILINIGHKSYNPAAKKVLIEIASAMYYSKLSMTDPNVDRFIQRINNNIDLVEHE
jgi:hypothetical protein